MPPVLRGLPAMRAGVRCRWTARTRSCGPTSDTRGQKNRQLSGHLSNRLSNPAAKQLSNRCLADPAAVERLLRLLPERVAREPARERAQHLDGAVDVAAVAPDLGEPPHHSRQLRRARM